jgi:hypothetical protein
MFAIDAFALAAGSAADSLSSDLRCAVSVEDIPSYTALMLWTNVYDF